MTDITDYALAGAFFGLTMLMYAAGYGICVWLDRRNRR
jgi:hypothetical protein